MNFLKLNDSKVKCMILRGKTDLGKIRMNQVRVGDANIKKSAKVRNIGAHLDETITMKE